MDLPAPGDLDLHAQPIVRLDDGGFAGAELFLRWIHPERGYVSAGEWIPRALAAGELADHTLHQLPTLARLATNLPPGRLSWNLSNGEVADDRVVDALVGLGPASNSRLALELHHSQFVGPGPFDVAPPDDLDARLDRLRRAGFEIWLDDLGEGPGGEQVAARRDVDLVKLDRSLLRGDPARLADVAGSILARGKPVIVEGIEDRAGLERARGAAIPLGQGFLFAPPLPPQELAGFAAHGPAC